MLIGLPIVVSHEEIPIGLNLYTGRRRWLLWFPGVAGAALLVGLAGHGATFRISVAFLLFTAVTTVRWPPTLPEALKTALGASLLMWLAGIAAVSLGLELAVASGPADPQFLTRQAYIALTLAPVSAGYVAGTVKRNGRDRAALGILLGAIVFGWLCMGGLTSTMFLDSILGHARQTGPVPVFYILFGSPLLASLTAAVMTRIQ